jgi:hypothetical protein
MRRLAAALAAAAVCAACGGTLPESKAPAPASPVATPRAVWTPLAEYPPIVGGTPRQRAELRLILAGLGAAGIQRVAIRPPGVWKPFRPGDVKLVITLGDPIDVRAQWKAYMLGGAFYERLLELGGPRLVAIEVVGEGGSRIAGLKPSDDQQSGVPTDGLDPGDLENQVRAAAEVADATVESLEALTPLGVAFAVTLRVDDPAAFLKNRTLPFLDSLPDRGLQLDGSFVEVLDTDGKRVWFVANASRGRVGMLWTRPDLEGCNPIAHSSPVGGEIPPCPA